jgi:hypothetical protein
LAIIAKYFARGFDPFWACGGIAAAAMSAPSPAVVPQLTPVIKRALATISHANRRFAIPSVRTEVLYIAILKLLQCGWKFMSPGTRGIA